MFQEIATLAQSLLLPILYGVYKLIKKLSQITFKIELLDGTVKKIANNELPHIKKELEKLNNRTTYMQGKLDLIESILRGSYGKVGKTRDRKKAGSS